MGMTRFFPCEKAQARPRRGPSHGNDENAHETAVAWLFSVSRRRKKEKREKTDVDEVPIMAARQKVSKCKKPSNYLFFFQALTSFYRKGSASSSSHRPRADDSSDGDGMHSMIFGKYNIFENAWHDI